MITLLILIWNNKKSTFCLILVSYMGNIHQDGTPLEIFRFVLLTCVRPINVRFSNVFFWLSDKRCLMLIFKKNVEQDKS